MAVDIPLSVPLQLVAYFTKADSIPAILSIILLMCFSMAFLLHVSSKEQRVYPKRRLSELYSSLVQDDEDKLTEVENQTLPEMISKLRVYEILKESRTAERSAERMSLECSSWEVLKLIGMRLRQDSRTLKEAAELDLHIIALDYVAKSLPTAEHNKISLAIDITNSLLQDPEALKTLSENREKCTAFVRTLLSVIRVYLDIGEVTECDEDTEMNAVDASMIDYFPQSGYKFILSLGLIISDNIELNSVCADNGSIFTVLECMKLQKSSSSLAKWCLWAMMNICFDHPPNKSIFVHKNGLTAVIAILRHHSCNLDVHKQGLSLLFYLLSDNIQSKFHIKDARRTALSLGIITVIEAAQINFKEESTVQDPCNYLLQILATEFD